MIRVNEQESMEEEKDEEEEVKGTPDPWMVTQAMNTVNPFVRSVEEVASPSKSLKRTEPPVVEPTESGDHSYPSRIHHRIPINTDYNISLCTHYSSSFITNYVSFNTNSSVHQSN